MTRKLAALQQYRYVMQLTRLTINLADQRSQLSLMLSHNKAA
ncbi:MAG TPA: hypothetical protein VIK49_02345 [Steroidobacteraceae bacterium]